MAFSMWITVWVTALAMAGAGAGAGAGCARVGTQDPRPDGGGGGDAGDAGPSEDAGPSGDAQVPVCGNGQREAGEQCDGADLGGETCASLDVGFTAGALGCLGSCQFDLANCVMPSCGNGQVDPGEECDDGNDSNNDACKNNCRFNTCGDGYVNIGVEDCDDGNGISGDGCENDCTFTCVPPEEGACGSCGTWVCQADNTWGPCAEYCEGRECGPDLCGGSCGSCPTSFACQADATCRLNSQCGGPPPPVATTFGFNYAPQGHLCRWVADEYSLVTSTFERDLDTMASLGARVVRVMLLPYCLGVQLVKDGGPHNWDQTRLAAVRTNLPVIIERFAAHGMSVILAFGPNAMYWNGPDASTKWWQHTYGVSGWSDFVTDMVDWSTEILEIVEPHGACSHVLYYDLHNEVDYGVAGMNTLVQAQLSQIPVPNGKRGISLLRVMERAQLSSDLAAAGVGLDYVEFHSYPDRAHQADVPAAMASVQSEFPGSHVLLGEFGGIFCENGESEGAQATTVMSVLDGADQAGVRAALHWMLWDRNPGTTCVDNERVGLGFEASLPRDVFGALAVRQSLVPNPDFETNISDWFVGGVTTDVQLLRGGPSATDAGTGLYYGRMQIMAPGVHWFCSTWFPVTGTHLALGGFVRHSGSKLVSNGIDVHFGNATSELSIASLGLPLFSGWSFNNIQNGLNGQAPPIPAAATRAFVCFVANAQASVTDANPAYVDIDAITAHGYTPR